VVSKNDGITNVTSTTESDVGVRFDNSRQPMANVFAQVPAKLSIMSGIVAARLTIAIRSKRRGSPCRERAARCVKENG